MKIYERWLQALLSSAPRLRVLARLASLAQIGELARRLVAVSLNALDFTVCYDLKKSTLQLCGLSEHVDVAFITN